MFDLFWFIIIIMGVVSGVGYVNRILFYEMVLKIKGLIVFKVFRY